MSPTKNLICREMIRRTLAHHAGTAPDPDTVAEATFIIWNLVATQLTPVIGTKGVDILFRRSLHLTSFSFPWLAMTDEYEDTPSLLSSTKARLANRETSDSTEAGCTLLITFTELLKTLIGESLTGRLLGKIWVSPSPTTKQENLS